MKRTAFFAVFMLFGIMPLMAYDFSASCSSGQTLYYNITDSMNQYVELTHPSDDNVYYWEGFQEPEGRLVLDATVTKDDMTYWVKSVGEKAFFQCKGITSLVISEGIEKIGAVAFCSCDAIETISFPESLNELCSESFKWCHNLTEVNLMGERLVVSGIPFESCGNLHSVNINVRTVSCSRMFYDCRNITSVTIGENVRFFVVDESMLNVNSDTRIQDVYFNATDCFSCRAVFNVPIERLHIGQNVTRIPDFAFCQTRLTELELPESLLYIGDYAFQRLKIKDLNIPNSVRTIGYHSFYNCEQLESVVIGKGLEGIPTGAFEDCRALKTVVIGSNVSYLAENAFGYCRKIRKVSVRATTPPALRGKTFFADDNFYVEIPCGMSETYGQAEYWKSFPMLETGARITVRNSNPNCGWTEIAKKPTCEDDEVIVKAHANDGDWFEAWLVDGEVVSTESVYVFHTQEDVELVALFGGTATTENNSCPLTIYPNPVKDCLNVMVPQHVNVQKIELFDVLGQLMLQKMPSDSSLDVQGLPSGCYILRICLENGMTYSSKVVKE